MTTDTLDFIRTSDPFIAIRIDMKTKPIFNQRVIAPTLFSFAQQNPSVTCTIYSQLLSAADVFSSPEILLLGIADSSSLAGVLFHFLKYTGKYDVTINSWMGGWVPGSQNIYKRLCILYHIQGGTTWEKRYTNQWEFIKLTQNKVDDYRELYN